MVSPARRRRALILLLLTWVVIVGVLGARYLNTRRDAAVKLDREAGEQEALRRMANMPAPPPTPPADVPLGEAGGSPPLEEKTGPAPRPAEPPSPEPAPEPESEPPPAAAMAGGNGTSSV